MKTLFKPLLFTILLNSFNLKAESIIIDRSAISGVIASNGIPISLDSLNSHPELSAAIKVNENAVVLDLSEESTQLISAVTRNGRRSISLNELQVLVDHKDLESLGSGFTEAVSQNVIRNIRRNSFMMSCFGGQGGGG